MPAGRFLYYATYKYVLLKDARLGLLYYVLAILTLIFTVVEIILKKGYLESSSTDTMFDTRPQGTVKLVLSDDLANKSFTASDLPYCGGEVPCMYLDPWELNWPAESRAITITTFGKDRIQYRNNHSNSPMDEYHLKEEKIYFTQGPEFVVVKVDHAVVASQFTDSKGKETLASSHRQLRGFLVDIHGDTIREISHHGSPDKLTIQELLKAAGLDNLDDKSDAIDAKGKSYRQRGLILRVTIFYQNWFSTWIGMSDVEYTYNVRHIPLVNYVSKQVAALTSKDEIITDVGTHMAQWRLVKKRYSIRIEFEQAGSLGQFSLSTLVMKLVSGMGLLTLTTTFIDVLAFYLLPNRNKYRYWAYEETPDLKTIDTTSKHKIN